MPSVENFSVLGCIHVAGAVLSSHVLEKWGTASEVLLAYT